MIVALAALAGAVVVVLATRGSFFTTDDHVFFAQAQETPFGGRFLTEPIFDHLSPWHRLLDHVVVSLTDQGWWLAQAVAVLAYAGCVAAFALVVRERVGRHPAGTVACVLFALSPVFVRAGQWWALANQQLPQLGFGLLCVWAALRWLRVRSTGWLVLALAAYALALAGFIKALLVPLLLVALLRERPARRDLPLWGGLAALSLAYLAVISGDRYYRFIPDSPGAGPRQWLEYVATAWTQGVVPLAVGVVVPEDPSAVQVALAVLACAAAVALVAWTVARGGRRVALRWAGAAGVVLATLVMSAGARLAEYGVDFVALDPRYNAEAVVALLLAGAVAVAAAAPRLRIGRVAGAAGALVVLGLAVDGAVRLERGFDGPRHRAFFTTFADSLAAVRRSTGGEPAVLEGTTPDWLITSRITGANLLSRALPLRDRSVRVGEGGTAPAVVDALGRVRPVRLRPVLAGTAVALGRAGRLTPAPRPGFGPAVCLGAPGRTALTLRVGAASRDPRDVHALELGFDRTTAPVAGDLLALGGGNPALPSLLTVPLRLRPGRTALRVLVSPSRLGQVRLQVGEGPRLCVRRVGVVRFAYPAG